jgi:hypothetical protein
MQSKQAYDKIGLEKILLDPAFRTIDAIGHVLPPSNEIYKTISHLMAEKGSKITAKHIHTIINNNRNGFKDRVMIFFDIKPDPVSFTTYNSDCLSRDQSTDTDTVKIINLVISSQKWKSIEPVEKEYGKRYYWRLREGWADVVAESMWVQHNISCVFVSKNNTVNKSAISRYYLTFDGYCRECCAKIRGTLLKEPAKDVDVVVKVTIEGLDPKAHTGEKRRQLRGIRRQRVADSLIDMRKDAITWRRKEAARLKQFGGKNPPMLPTNAVLRKAKEQRLIEAYGLQFSNPALNLQKNATQGKYLGCIHHVALLKFNCVYWRPEQLQIYVARCRKNENAQFIIDATGGIAKRDQSHDPHIFLYQCVLVTNDGSVPVFQMVSADQRALIVAQFLRLILAANAPIPPIVVTDFGWALLIAVAEIFGRCASLSEYLQKCYNALENKKISLPSTFIRLDVCHLAAMVSRWGCLKGNSLVGRFFKRCVGQASKITDLEELAYFLESVLVIALSKYIGCEVADGKLLASETRLRFLNEKIKGESCTDTDENKPVEDELEHEPENLESENENVGWKSWADDIYKKAQQLASHDGDTINACYNAEFAAKLKKHLLPYIPLWTAVMVPIFGRGGVTATSAAVESEFADLKKRDFKGELPMRVDRFVLQHLDRIDEKIKERSKETDVRPETPPGTTSISAESLSRSEISFLKDTKIGTSTPNEWSVKEDWGGLTKHEEETTQTPIKEPKKKRSKLTYFDNCPDWEFIKDARASRIPVLMNGSTLPPVRIQGCDWNITETCAFDSIFHVVINGMAINEGYVHTLSESCCPLIKLAREVGCLKKITKHHYILRADILRNVYFLRDSVETFTKNVRRLVARCNAAHLAQTLFDVEPSVKIETKCSSCLSIITKYYPLLDVNVNIILCGGLNKMQAAIDDCASIKRTCNKCANQMVASTAYGPHLVIDTAVMTDPGYPSHDSIKRHTLTSISKRVNVGARTYLLTGVVGYIAEMSHYVAYALTGNIWYKYDDLIKKRVIVNGETEVFPHIIIYMIHGSQKHM